jgi:hypothetical protein
MRRSLPIYPDKQTNSEPFVTSQKCHKPNACGEFIRSACISLHMTVSEPQALEGAVRAKRARAAGLPQRLKRCVAMWCDAQRRVEERCDAPRRVALPTVMSISPTRLTDDPNMVQSQGDFKTALLP